MGLLERDSALGAWARRTKIFINRCLLWKQIRGARRLNPAANLQLDENSNAVSGPCCQ